MMISDIIINKLCQFNGTLLLVQLQIIVHYSIINAYGLQALVDEGLITQGDHMSHRTINV
jgi:hypothetical protein